METEDRKVDDIIDCYLTGSMDGQEEAAFRERIASDPLLAERIETTRRLADAVCREADKDVLGALSKIASPTELQNIMDGAEARHGSVSGMTEGVDELKGGMSNISYAEARRESGPTFSPDESVDAKPCGRGDGAESGREEMPRIGVSEARKGQMPLRRRTYAAVSAAVVAASVAIIIIGTLPRYGAREIFRNNFDSGFFAPSPSRDDAAPGDGDCLFADAIFYYDKGRYGKVVELLAPVIDGDHDMHTPPDIVLMGAAAAVENDDAELAARWADALSLYGGEYEDAALLVRAFSELRAGHRQAAKTHLQNLSGDDDRLSAVGRKIRSDIEKRRWF